MLPGTIEARYRPTNRALYALDTYRPVAVEDRAEAIIEDAVVQEDIDGQLFAMVNLRVRMYPVAPEGRTPARYSLNN